MTKRKVGALEKVEANLANLQYKVRKDPISYREDFIKQYLQYESQRELFMQTAGASTANGVISLTELIDFIAHVADCYKDLTAEFPEELALMLRTHHANLESELREKLVSSLVLLRKKDILDSSSLLHTLFPILTTTPSKTLRALLFQKILSDLRSSNSKGTNHRLNRTIQTVLYNLLVADRASPKGLWAVKLTRELWKRQIWTDSKAVEIMKEASLADNPKVLIGGVRFFLGGDKEREDLDDESSDEEEVDMGKIKHQVGINKKTKKKSKQIDKAVAQIKKKERKKNQPHPLNFSALHLLNDPQGFAENLFQKHLQNSKSKLDLDQKLQVLQLVSRLVGLHKLTIISLYSYFIKYLTPRQPSVTSFLASLAQSTHPLVPPDVLEPLVLKIANEFVSEASAAEIASAGLNAIREICVRQPLAMNDILLQDLVMYKKSKDKGVVMAAKGLLSLYREVGAELLKKRDRGKDATMGIRAGERKEKRFGEEEAGEIEGLELLERWKEEQKRRKREELGLPAEVGSDEGSAWEDEAEEDEAGWDNWEVDEDESDDSGGWLDVESDNDIEVSDDEEEKAPLKKVKLSKSPNEASNSSDDETKTSFSTSETKIPSLATTKILTPADLAKLQELRLQASVDNAINGNKSKRRKELEEQKQRHIDDPLTAESIEALSALSRRADRESKMAAAAAGKTDRSEYRSKEARRQERKIEQGKSSTNKEKARKKNFLMTLGKARVKKKRSLTEQRRVLKSHLERAKRGGKRGNKG